jgi:hypothetical protein
MPYKIVITRIDKDVPFRNHEYKKAANGTDEDGDPKYEYVYFDDTRTETTDIFEQTVEDLNVSDVVAVVNGLPKADHA